VVGEAFDPEEWLRNRKEKGQVRALMCDSTNVFSPHPGRSEASLAEPISETLMVKSPGMVVATTFASNVARLKTLAEAGAPPGGRSAFWGGRCGGW
jgi:ribonuclease J